jgi:hypothetical protein
MGFYFAMSEKFTNFAVEKITTYKKAVLSITIRAA